MSQMHQIRFPASVRSSVRLFVHFKLHLRDGRTDTSDVVLETKVLVSRLLEGKK